MSTFDKLISGYRLFKATTYEHQKEMVKHFLALGIKPSTLVVTSCSLQISPDILTSSNPGELFVIRNIGGLLPPYGEHECGTIAAVEYAVQELEVENVIVLGHTHCDGIEMMMNNKKVLQDASDPMAVWMKIAASAKNAVKETLSKKSEEEQEAACEKEAILVSMKNLIEYPFVKKRIDLDNIDIYGWHFDIETGELSAFDPTTKFFELVQ